MLLFHHECWRRSGKEKALCQSSNSSFYFLIKFPLCDLTEKVVATREIKLILSENRMNYGREECGKPDSEGFCLYLRSDVNRRGGKSDSS